MNDLISRQAASDLLEMALIDDWEPEYAQDRLSEIPAADVRPVVKGHFGKHTSPFTAPCSECGTSMNLNWNYCPNCGADMREVNSGDTRTQG